jgi:hypothetical protein
MIPKSENRFSEKDHAQQGALRGEGDVRVFADGFGNGRLGSKLPVDR